MNQRGPSRDLDQVRNGVNLIGLGGCRQAILEAAQLSGGDVEILCASGDGSTVEQHAIGELIPFGFGPANHNPSVL